MLIEDFYQWAKANNCTNYDISEAKAALPAVAAEMGIEYEL